MSQGTIIRSDLKETNKLEYIAMSGQSDRFKKKWAREQARKVYRDSK